MVVYLSFARGQLKGVFSFQVYPRAPCWPRARGWVGRTEERRVTDSWLILSWMSLASVCCNVGRSSVEINRKVGVLFRTMLSDFRNFIAFCKVPRLRPFIVLVTAACRWRWVWSIVGMILTGGTEMLGEQPHLITLCLHKILIWTLLGSNPGLRRERPATDRLKHGTTLQTKVNMIYI